VTPATRTPTSEAPTSETFTGATPTSETPATPGPSRQLLRPYGDTTGDAMVQTSFTLPLPAGARADGAALQLAHKMGLDPATVVHSKAMGPDFTFFVVYGRVNHLVDPGLVQVEEREWDLLTPSDVNLAVRSGLNRRLVVLGACIGTDAHTVGIDAILNIKGFAGEKGLEYYRELDVVNLGAQVTVDELVAAARERHADAVLVSQVVTQKNAHVHNAKQLAAAFHAAFDVTERPLLIVGGPRFDTVTADELGVDRVFGKGTTPGEVASYLVHTFMPGWTPADGPGTDGTGTDSAGTAEASGEGA
jgi:methanogenic corrinoid protein MtbC1